MNSKDFQISQFNSAYFIGIGGIGMSALARYFNALGWSVAGYDKTETPLTKKLVEEGINVHYEDFGSNIPHPFINIDTTLIIYTPAIPAKMGELNYFQTSEFNVFKRAQVLGMITRNSTSLTVAGTHGKTTTSCMLAHILNESSLKCSAFLGGISTNFNSNFISSTSSNYTVIEADEFDRSFLSLQPFASIVTSTDADHLDIYEDNGKFLEGFKSFVELINPNGFLVRSVHAQVDSPNAISYGIDCDADYVGSNLHFENNEFVFDLATPDGFWKDIKLGIAGIHNAENAIACIVMCLQIGVTEAEIRNALQSFAGVKRRFEYIIKKDNLIYIDDYAHHPTEIKALISSVKLLYPSKKIIGVFQPHLFTRTRDFFAEFGRELSRLDEVILLPIYPAREEVIAGITSDALVDIITISNKSVLHPEAAIKRVSEISEGIILTIGAGDIDRIVEPIKSNLSAV